MSLLHLVNPETVALAKRLAERTGESLTTAVTEALRERLARLDEPAPQERLVRMRAITAITAPLLSDSPWARDIDAILYDGMGLPK